MDEITVFSLNSGNGDGADIIFDINDQRVAVSIFPGPSSEHNIQVERNQQFLEDRLIELLGRAVLTEDDDEYERITDEVLGIILDAGKTIFSEVAPRKKSDPKSFKQDLQSYLYPPTLAFRIESAGSRVTMVPIGPEESYTNIEIPTNYRIDDSIDIDNDLPQYPPKDITIVESFAQGLGHSVSRVLVNGQEMLCKARAQGLHDPYLERELSHLLEIRRGLPSYRTSIRVPQLLGYVKHTESGHVIGLLREWVPGGCLADLDLSVVSVKAREKWASQIRETVDQLHEIGLNWGDVKASNVIIDELDDAWLIEFGGGFTDGWVEKDLADTPDGDRQGIKKIIEFLGVEERI
ncbi:hypothetical protein F4680DRAFT_407180 [Xylaria scruposa]|nr:hypothetical protein F4680DRAFT_407180 [Xylaria scruposa]